ncbi:hypothetical protein BUL40_02330 [Croceivirga radicis]|uniref:Uncharacterized protein n=1 Tax=Croceivirga radicis TaxID=1929488 RepID=A0A1V6LWI2_9FLAO|nr:hypothetical protein [Croceivirga radicis]OQD44542.1 hypothetical protein BUL40_02330 [Croceivirga radicis]
MSKKKLQFLNKLELFYRNFGNEWTLDEIIVNKEHHGYYLNFLKDLEKQNIVKIDSERNTFTIIDLSTKYLSKE